MFARKQLIGRSQHKLWPLKVSYENRPLIKINYPGTLCVHRFKSSLCWTTPTSSPIMIVSRKMASSWLRWNMQTEGTWSCDTVMWHASRSCDYTGIWRNFYGKRQSHFQNRKFWAHSLRWWTLWNISTTTRFFIGESTLYTLYTHPHTPPTHTET